MLVHPFDDPLVMAGQGTVGLEVLEDAPDVDMIAVPVGGAGLIAGIAAAVAPRGVRVVGVEPEGSAALGLALEAGEPVPVTPRTIASGLDAPYAGRHALAVCSAAGVEVVTVDRRGDRGGDAEALRRREARVRAGRRGRCRRGPRRARSRRLDRCRCLWRQRWAGNRL